jgi:hypothetical protein
MKFAIVTLIGDNQGNRLQNYALQQILAMRGCNVETLKNYSESEVSLRAKVSKSIKTVLALFIRKYYVEKKRHDLFKEFNKNIVFSKYTVTNEHIPNGVLTEYDCFICGSDQVWNADYLQNGIVNFLGFAPTSRKASFAASLGTKVIATERVGEIKQYLDSFEEISVRESSSVPILKSITNRPIRVDLDPSLLLYEEDWRNKERRPQNLGTRPYILLYFLGSISEKAWDIANQIKVEHGYDLIDLNDPGWYGKVGPSQFLYLINHAESVLTDSFHGTAFSIIFHKQFLSFRRDGIGQEMEDRITNLLDSIGLQDRFVVDACVSISKINYNEVDHLLETERKKSLEYIDRIIEKCKRVVE